MDIKQYDTVLLKDGRQGAVVEIFGDCEVFAIDFGSSPKDWHTDYDVKINQIEKVIK